MSVRTCLGGLPRTYPALEATLGLAGPSAPWALQGRAHGDEAYDAAVEAGMMIDVYGLDEAADRWRQTALTLAPLRCYPAAFSEQGSRSHFWTPISQLEAHGEGYQTRTVKSWVTAAHHADSYVASAQAPGAQSPLESTLYWLRRQQVGVQLMGRFNGLGLRGNDSAPITFEGVDVAKTAAVAWDMAFEGDLHREVRDDRQWHYTIRHHYLLLHREHVPQACMDGRSATRLPSTDWTACPFLPTGLSVASRMTCGPLPTGSTPAAVGQFIS